jgi:hypothetical protein
MPVYRFEMETRLSVDEAMREVRAITRSPRSFSESLKKVFEGEGRNPVTPFVGVVKDSSFRIVRDINGRNSFLPVIHGRAAATAGGSRLMVCMTLHWAVVAFLLFFFYAAKVKGFGVPLVPAFILLFIALLFFFLEVFMARRILEERFMNAG